MTNSQVIIDIIDKFSEFIGRSVAWLTLLMAIIAFMVVLLRYAFNVGSIALQESVIFTQALMFLLSAGYILKQDKHIRVDVLYRNFTPRTRAWIDSIGTIVFLLPLCGLIFLVSLSYVGLSWQIKETSPEPSGLPAVYILKALIPLFAFTLFVQGLAECLRNAITLLKKTTEDV